MAISATRFKVLDEESNIATVDFKSIADNAIFNSPNNADKNPSAELESLIKSAIETPPSEIPVPSVVAAIASNAPNIPATPERAVKSLGAVTKDLTALNKKDIDKAVAGLLPGNTQAQNAFNKLSDSCKNDAMKDGGIGKPNWPELDCNGKKKPVKSGGCSTSTISDILNKLTNGGLDAKFNDINNLIKNLINLAGMGYKGNLCGVFSALTEGASGSVISKAAVGVFKGLTSTGNSAGIIDLAGAVAGTAASKNIVAQNPNAISDVFKNFKNPDGLTEVNYNIYNDSVVGSLSTIDDKWALSPYDGAPSISKLGATNTDTSKLFTSKILSTDYTDLNALDDIHAPDSLFTNAAIVGNSNPSQGFDFINTNSPSDEFDTSVFVNMKDRVKKAISVNQAINTGDSLGGFDFVNGTNNIQKIASTNSYTFI